MNVSRGCMSPMASAAAQYLFTLAVVLKAVAHINPHVEAS